MADTKITALTAITSITPATFPLPIVDLLDTTMAGSGTTKKVTVNQILGCGGTATLASATITGDLTVDTNVLKVDSANNRVGVLTATPGYPLHVNGTDATNVLFNGATKGVRFVASASKYSITGVDNTGAATFQPLAIGGASLEFQIGSTTHFSIDASGNATWSNVGGVAGTAMTLNSTGLGVGVTPSAGRMHIKGGASQSPLVLDTLGYNQIVLQLNGANRGQIYADATNCLALVDSTGSNLRLVVTDSGNVGVGVTPSATLDVYTSSGDCTAQFKSNAAGSNVISTLDYVSSYGITRIKKSGTTVWETGVIGSTSATPSYSIFNASSIGVYLTSGGTSWTGISDERLKDIIEPISNAVQKVGSLRSVIGKFKNDETNTRRSFLIAQDVQAVLPEAVDASNPDRLGVAYTEVIPLLVAAIKELTARVQTLETR